MPTETDLRAALAVIADQAPDSCDDILAAAPARSRRLLWPLSAAAIVAAVAVTVPFLTSAGDAHHRVPSTGYVSVAPSGDGTVTGMLRLVGGPAPGIDEPASGVVYAFTSSSLSGTQIAKAKTGSDGSFHLNLPPGTYYLAGTSPSFSIDSPPSTPPCRADGPVVVSEGSISQVDVACPMK